MTRKSRQLNCMKKLNPDFCTMQRDTYGKNIFHLKQWKTMSGITFSSLSRYLDAAENVLRVGGRIKTPVLEVIQKHTILSF